MDIAFGIVCARDFNVMRPRAGFNANAAFNEPVGKSYNPYIEYQAGLRPYNISSLRLKLFLAAFGRDKKVLNFVE